LLSITDDEVARAARDAGIDDIVAWAVVHRGGDKITFRIEAEGGPYIVQFYDRTEAVAGYALPFVAWAAARRYPTPAPRRMRSGDWLHRSIRPAAAFPFIEGTHPPAVTIEVAEAMGSTLALLHRIGRDFVEKLPVIDRLQLLREAMTEAGRHPPLASWSGVARRFLHTYEARWQTAAANLPSGPIHHDFHTDNLLFAGDAVACVLDFDEVQRAPFVIDIARAFHYIAGEAPDLRLPLSTVVTFLRAYDAIRSLHEVERDALDLAFQLANLAHVAFSIIEPLDRPASLDASQRHQIYLANLATRLPVTWPS
jgi:homoserine kinase type II